MLSILCVRLTIKVKVGIPESFKVGWYPPKKLGRVTLRTAADSQINDKSIAVIIANNPITTEIYVHNNKTRKPQ